MTTREQLIEAMARTICARAIGPNGGHNMWSANDELQRSRDMECAAVALTAIEAAGLCIVPVEATGVMERSGWEVEELATPDRVYRAMIETGRL